MREIRSPGDTFHLPIWTVLAFKKVSDGKGHRTASEARDKGQSTILLFFFFLVGDHYHPRVVKTRRLTANLSQKWVS